MYTQKKSQEREAQPVPKSNIQEMNYRSIAENLKRRLEENRKLKKEIQDTISAVKLDENMTRFKRDYPQYSTLIANQTFRNIINAGIEPIIGVPSSVKDQTPYHNIYGGNGCFYYSEGVGAIIITTTGKEIKLKQNSTTYDNSDYNQSETVDFSGAPKIGASLQENPDTGCLVVYDKGGYYGSYTDSAHGLLQGKPLSLKEQKILFQQFSHGLAEKVINGGGRYIGGSVGSENYFILKFDDGSTEKISDKIIVKPDIKIYLI